MLPRGQRFPVKMCQHSIYTRGTSIPPQGEPSRSSLYRFNFLDRTNCIWVPHGRAILQNWAYIGLVCQSFYPGIAYINISPDETKRTVASAANVVYVFIPAKVTCNVDPKVLNVIHMFKMVTMYVIGIRDRIFFLVTDITSHLSG